MQKKYSLLFILWTILLVVPNSYAHDYMLKHIETCDGLSGSQVNVVFQDSRGFMWFGTASGLNRYDGFHVDVYRSDLDNLHSLPASYIRDIQESGDGNLWVLTNGGYSLYNPYTNMFDRDVRQHVFEFGLDELPSQVYIDSKKNYWFYVEGKGCYWYNVSQKILYPFLHGEKASMLPLGNVTDMCECKEGVLLIYESGLVVCINGDMRRIVWANDYVPASGAKPTVYTAFVDKNENVWVYGATGLFIYIKGEDKWIASLESMAKQWEQPLQEALKDAVVGVVQDAKGRIWVATRHEGVLVLDPQEKNIVSLQSVVGDVRSLKHNSLRCIYADPTKDLVWIGTARSGVSYYSESAFKFHVDANYDVTAIEPDGDNGYWLGTSESGLLYYSSQTGMCEPLKALKGKPHDAVYALMKSRKGQLWIGTDRGYVYCVDGKSCKEYRVMSGDIKPHPSDCAVTSFVEDDRGNVWMATMGAGLQCLDVKSGRITTIYNKDKNQLPSNKITSLFMAKNRRLIMGTPQGISILDILKGTSQTYVGCKTGNRPFAGLYVNQVLEDCRGLLWIATRDALNVYDPKNDMLDILTIADGLPNSAICGLVEVDEQNIWVTTSGGIAHILVEKEADKNDYSFRIYSYTEEDGLQSSEFNGRAIAVSGNGHLAVGGLQGLNVFHPDAIVFNKKQPRVLFSGLRLFNERVVAGKEYDGHVILKGEIGQENRIVLTPEQSMFTLMFGSDDYSMPEKVRFKYKLEGFHEEWLTCMPWQHELTFTNLRPGKYVLKLKAVNSDGYNGDDASQLVIEVKGGIGSSVWIYIICILLFVLLLGVLLKSRRKSKTRDGANGKSTINKESFPTGAVSLSTVNESIDEAEDNRSVGILSSSEDVSEVNTNSFFKTILIVDENQEYLSFLSDGVGNAYSVIQTSQVEEAWDLLVSQMPSMLLCSISAFDGKGVELCRLVKENERTCNVPVILLTASEYDNWQTLGVDDCLVKPFTIDLLLKRIRLILSDEANDSSLDSEERTNVAASLSSAEGDDLIVVEARRYVEENISRSDLSVEEMARELGMSRAHLYKKLVAGSGKTPIEFIRSIRLRRAVELLKDSRYNVSEVAYQVGFNNPKYFTKYFTDEFGMLPSVYRDKALKRGEFAILDQHANRPEKE